MKKIKYLILNLIIISTLSIIFTGCATTGINYNEKTKSLVLENNGEALVLSEVTASPFTKNKIYVVEEKGNSSKKTYWGTTTSPCTRIEVFEYLSLGTNRYYLSSVLDDLKEIYRGYKIKKYGQIYLATNGHKVTLAFETNNMHGIDSKTYIGVSNSCLMKFRKQYQNNNKSIWYKPTEIIEN